MPRGTVTTGLLRNVLLFPLRLALTVTVAASAFLALLLRCLED